MSLLLANTPSFDISPDTTITAIITVALGVLALVNASRAKRERAAVDAKAANFKAFEQAQSFYDTTNQRLTTEVAQLQAENVKQAGLNRALSRQIDHLERLVRDLGGALPDDWTRPQGG